MTELFNKYAKYIPLLICIVYLFSYGIPDILHSQKTVFVYEYLILFGVGYLLAILEDFFKISEKISKLLRVVIIVISIILLITAILNQAMFSIVFSGVILVAFNLALYLQNKQNKQKD